MTPMTAPLTIFNRVVYWVFVSERAAEEIGGLFAFYALCKF